MACNVPYDRTVKVMRGEVLMRFEDLAMAEQVLGGILRTDNVMSPGTHRIEQVEANSRQET